MAAYEFLYATESDYDVIAKMYDDAISYQIRNNYPVWKGHKKENILKDVEGKNLYKLMSDGKIACAFTLHFSDNLIWGDRDQGDSVFLSRVIINPIFKGQRLFGRVLDWIKRNAVKENKLFIRMDTWANNPDIISYFESFGFKQVGKFRTPQSDKISAAYWDVEVVLLEIRV